MLCSLSAIGQKIAPTAVPKAVSEVFIKDFPGIMAEWELRNGQYVATFEQNKYNMQTVYDKNGRRLETHVTIADTELPAPALEYLKSHQSADVTEATKIIMANDQVSFKVLSGGQYLEFDAKGNYRRSMNK